MILWEHNFHNFRSKQPKSADYIIRIHEHYWKRGTVDAAIFCIESDSSCTLCDWAEMLDMEIRIEDNLTLTDADIVAFCIWLACDCFPTTEERINSWVDKMGEKMKTIRENYEIEDDE
jgi:hypothetical protein